MSHFVVKSVIFRSSEFEKEEILSRAPQIMINSDATILRALPRLPLKARVMIARSTKFVPPAKPVSLSNLKREWDRKKELIYNCDEESDREIVIIKDIDCSHVCCGN